MAPLKETVTKAKLKFQLFFSQSNKINKTNFPTFSMAQSTDQKILRALLRFKRYELKLLRQLTVKTKEIHDRLFCNVLHTFKTMKLYSQNCLE